MSTKTHQSSIAVAHKPEHLHWHYLYKKRRHRVLGVSAKDMAWSQVFSLLGSLVAGYLLEVNKQEMAALAGVFIVLPAVFDLGSSIGAALSAKINHLMETKTDASEVFTESIWFAYRQSVISSFIVAIFAATIAKLFFNGEFWSVFALAVGAVAICSTIGFPIIGGMSVFIRRLGMNPDDVVGPIESSIFDILTVVSIAFLVGYVL